MTNFAARLAPVDRHMGCKADLSHSGGPQSPNWHKELGIRYRCFTGIATNVCVESTLRNA